MGDKIKLVIETEDRVQLWLTRMLRLASSAIRWRGLPDSIDTVLLEKTLTRNGSAIIVYDQELKKWLNGANASTGQLDVYSYPNNRSVIFNNGIQAWYDTRDTVIIYNNSERCGDYWFYNLWANDLANIDMAVRVNINSQKTMPIIPSSQQQALSAKNLYSDIEENKGYRVVDDSGFDVEKFKSALQFKNRDSFTADNMISVQRELWNRCLTFMGINNVNVEKRERVNTFETNANLDEIMFMRRDRLNSRDRACIMMKEKWGWDVTADYYSESDNKIGGEEVVTVHNTSAENS